jgi:Fungal tRNA ligase phosphodiesterase domain
MSLKQIIKIAEQMESKYPLNRKDIMYYGVFVDDPKDLEQKFIEKTGLDLLDGKKHCHHMTIKFKPSIDDQIHEELIVRMGDSVKINVLGYAANEKCQAVLVECSEVGSANSNAHITISCADGIPPSESNNLLATEEIKPLKGVVLSGKIGACLKNNKVIF